MSLANWLSLAIELLTVVQLVALGRKKRWGWLVGLFCQIPWAMFCLLTGNFPFLVGVVIFGVLDYKGWSNWNET